MSLNVCVLMVFVVVNGAVCLFEFAWQHGVLIGWVFGCVCLFVCLLDCGFVRVYTYIYIYICLCDCEFVCECFCSCMCLCVLLFVCSLLFMCLCLFCVFVCVIV